MLTLPNKNAHTLFMCYNNYLLLTTRRDNSAEKITWQCFTSVKGLRTTAIQATFESFCANYLPWSPTLLISNHNFQK
jgi:hypothetical protein